MFKSFAFAAILLACLGQPASIPGTSVLTEKPTLTLKTAFPPATPNGARLFIFEGDSTTPVHRSGPEHFKLTRLSNGERVELTIACDRESLNTDEGAGCPRTVKQKVKRAKTVTSFNYQFKGVQLSLDTGDYDAKEGPQTKNHLVLYGRAVLRAGERYQLTWACWPVGATKASELTCEFEVAK